MIAFGREIRDLSVAKKKEFLLAAEGDYCSQSLAGNTRKYHGLLVHHDRVLLSTCDEYLDGERISVATYAGLVQKEGLRWLYGFSLYPPCFSYIVGDTFLCKTIEFDGQVCLRYAIWGDGELRVVPLIADRSIHALQEARHPEGHPIANGVEMEHLVLTGDGCSFIPRPDWYRNIQYDEDCTRGFPCLEDLYTPGYFGVQGRNWSVTVRAMVRDAVPTRLSKRPAPRDPLSCLRYAADDFIIGETMVAGYHWFPESWGRDTFVSLPGLLLDRGMFRKAEEIFRYFARRMKRGIIPNRIPDSYHSSDATLWFLWALTQYGMWGGRQEFLAEMKPFVEEILSEYGEGGVATLEGDLIRVAPQSTWMDTAFTPREGKPVEVNALWIHALAQAPLFGLEPPLRPEMARKSFDRFWNEDAGHFYDRIDPMDAALRPNQLIALAVGLGDLDQRKRALETIQRHLLTPYGLRTLAPAEPGYRGRYAGDASYHNGSVWPWLLGPYVEASLRSGNSPDRLRCVLRPLLIHLHDAGLGTVSEYFDGDPPHSPGGCIAQAWSVAELLRAHRLIDRAAGRP
jgi:glycogen debranching enzyme